ncbi:MAG: 4'-phosphopantetheinyl transferase superfamily protein, partial [Myxococcaceae bacterium]|nr:4'-phosphopantetheinyl transferase superfamily protein [Myxococcaceae bacterium]
MVLGLGLDICSVERMRRILEGPRAERFLARVFTEEERAYCGARADAAAAFAGRFAAKEALTKALGAPSGLAWKHMEVPRTSGAP